MRRWTAVATVVAIGGLVGTSSSAGGQAAGSAPDSFSVVAKGAPVVIEAAFPTVLPLQVEAGLAATNLRISSQPLASAGAAPLWVPVLGALPETSDAAALADCTVASPGDRLAADCGAPGQDVVGLGRLGAASGHAEVQTEGAVRARAEAGLAEAGTGPGATEVIQLRGVASEVSAAVEGDSVVGRARASVEGITIAGVVRVGAVEALAEGRLGAGVGPSSLEFETPTFVLEVAGVPVVVDGEGIHLADTVLPGAQGPLEALVNETLAELGMSLELVPGAVEELDEEGTRLRATTPGLRISFAEPGSGNALALVLGRLELTMSATRFGELPPVSVPDQPEAVAGTGGSSAPDLAAPSFDAPPSDPVADGGVRRPATLVTVPVALDLEDWLPLYAALLAVAGCGPLVVVARSRIPIPQRRARHDR